jgi:hypothetical protein
VTVVQQYVAQQDILLDIHYPWTSTEDIGQQQLQCNYRLPGLLCVRVAGNFFAGILMNIAIFM